MLAGLTAIQALIELPTGELCDMPGVSFVISCDEDKLAHALALPDPAAGPASARAYLDRVFQFRVEIAPPPKLDMRAFARERLEEHFGDVLERIEATGAAVDNVLDRLVPVHVGTPRAALSNLNAFLLAWGLAELREREARSERAGGLAKGAVTNHAEALAAICSLKAGFPEFYSDVQEEPRLLHSFGDRFVREVESDRVPGSIRAKLDHYADGHGEPRWPHRQLRQYVASLTGIEWPQTLEPLVRLLQDTTSRTFGDAARPVFEALVSGDLQGLEAALGEDLRTGPLSTKAVALVTSLVEDIQSRETDVRVDNAFAALGGLAHRLPPDRTAGVRARLAERATTSPTLRWRLGLDVLESLIPAGPDSAMARLLEALVSDVLRLDGESGFRTPFDQSPNLEQASDAARRVCEMALARGEQQDLTPGAAARLDEWLLARSVAVEEGVEALPFSDLQAWLSEHGDWLLPRLGLAFTEHATAVCQGQQKLDESALTAQLRAVFEQRDDEGEESRRLVWRQLRDLVESGRPTIRAAAAQLATTLRRPSPETVAEFLIALSRATVAAEAQESEPEVTRAIFTLLRAPAGLSSDAHADLVNLADYWAAAADSSDCIKLLDWLLEAGTPLLAKKCTEWATTPLNEPLHPDVIGWVAPYLDSLLDAAGRARVATEVLQPWLAIATEEDASAASKYRYLLERVPDPILEEAQWAAHLKAAGQGIRRNLANAVFVQNVLPALLGRANRTPIEGLTAILVQCMTSTMQPSSPTAELFWATVADCGWPVDRPTDAALTALVEGATESIPSPAASELASPVIRSFGALLRSRDLSESQQDQLAELVLAVWPTAHSEGLEVLGAVVVQPKPDSLAEALSRVDWTSEESVECSRSLLRVAAQSLDDDRRSDVTVLLRDRAPVPGRTPDAGLSGWLDALDAVGTDLSLHLLDFLAPELDDDGMRRIVAQAVARAESLRTPFFSQLVRALPVEADASWRELLGSRAAITTAAKASGRRPRELAEALVRTLDSHDSEDRKSEICSWVADLTGSGILDEGWVDELDLGDASMHALRDVFPEARRFRTGALRRMASVLKRDS